jgi:hypothetical protein
MRAGSRDIRARMLCYLCKKPEWERTTHAKGSRISGFGVQLFTRLIEKWELCVSVSFVRREISWRGIRGNLVPRACGNVSWCGSGDVGPRPGKPANTDSPLVAAPIGQFIHCSSSPFISCSQIPLSYRRSTFNVQHLRQISNFRTPTRSNSRASQFLLPSH